MFLDSSFNGDISKWKVEASLSFEENDDDDLMLSK
jgi:hypothetical protein